MKWIARLWLVVATAFLVVMGLLIYDAVSADAATTPQWTLKWDTSFVSPVALGRFSGCSSTPPYTCSGLPAFESKQWGAYPKGWPDTASQRNYPVHGYYEPQDDVWVSNHQMHIRMSRPGSGNIESAALVPKAAYGMKYGKFVETFQVSKQAAGYKSAHLLWPISSNLPWEEDYPEGDWDNTGFWAYDHNSTGGQQSFKGGVFNAGWNRTEIDWTPQGMTFFLNGNVIGQSSVTPNVPMEWVIQNESSLDGEQAAPNSSAQMNIRWVAVYSYSGAS